MDEITFKVKGSSPEPYEVIFIKDGDSLTAICSCPAGQYGNFCKHRMSILDGNAKAVISDNKDQVDSVVNWLIGTDVESALAEMRALEKGGAETKDELTVAKRKVARAMNS